MALTSIYAQDTSVKIKVKDGNKPIIYIDGKKYDYSVLKLLDPDKFATISVVKGEKALREYNASDGVIIITTKENTGKEAVKSDSFDKNQPFGKLKIEQEPKIIVNGKVFNHSLSTIDPKEIETINVIKGEKATKEYNSPNGVIIIKTKAGKPTND